MQFNLIYRFIMTMSDLGLINESLHMKNVKVKSLPSIHLRFNYVKLHILHNFFFFLAFFLKKKTHHERVNDI